MLKRCGEEKFGVGPNVLCVAIRTEIKAFETHAAKNYWNALKAIPSQVEVA